MAGAAALAAQIPGLLVKNNWLEAALAQDSNVVRDTINGLVAFVVPGRDPYSVAQGHTSGTPGGIAAGGTDATIKTLDAFIGSPVGASFPSSSAIAGALNSTALTVNPAATNGNFVSPFSRLSFPEKIEVFNRVEQTTEGSEFRYVAGVLIATVAFVVYSEISAFDPETRRLTGRPIAWRLTKYSGVRDARHQLQGYWRGRRRVRTAKRYRVGNQIP